MKRLFSSILLLVMLLTMVACVGEGAKVETADHKATGNADNTTIRLMALQGPTGMGLAQLLHDQTTGESNRCQYDAELVTSAEISNIAAAISKGECDIAAVPINLASNLYAKTSGQVQVLCANTLGVLYLLENGQSVQSAADLKGKTIYATGQGSTPEYVLRYVLKENGIDPDNDVTLQFVADHAELASYLAADIYAIGMLPEPNVSVVLGANPNFRIALNMTEEWNKVAGENNPLIQGVFIARSAFVREHPALVSAFLDDYNDSQRTVNENPEQGAEFIVEAGILGSAAIAKKAIPGCNITFLEGESMKSGVAKCLQVLFDANSASVGNAVPGDDFYFIR